MVRLAGFEPATYGLEGRCSIRLSYRRMLRLLMLAGSVRREWSGWRDSNPRHPAPKAGALPGCATPRTCRSSEAAYYSRPRGASTTERLQQRPPSPAEPARTSCRGRLNTCSRVLHVGVFRVTGFHRASDTPIRDGQVCSTQTSQGLRAQRHVRKIAHNFDRIDQRLFLVGSQCLQVTIVEIDQRFQTFARLEVQPV